jgi:hypothetical protein
VLLASPKHGAAFLAGRRGDLRSRPGLLASSNGGGVLPTSLKEDVGLSVKAYAVALRVRGESNMEAIGLCYVCRYC